MSDVKFRAFVTEFQNGLPAPPVDAEDIRRMWEFINRTRAEAANAGVRGKVSLTSAMWENACGPGANIGAVWVRTSLIELVQSSGLLKPWEEESGLDYRVFKVAVVYPMRIGSFDPEEFIKQLNEEQ